MTNDNSRAKRRTPHNDEVPGLLKELEAAGGNVLAFTRERGLSPWKLYEARRRSAKGSAPRPAPKRRDRFLPVELIAEPPHAAPPLELVLVSGHKLRVPSGFEEASLRRLVKVLASC